VILEDQLIVLKIRTEEFAGKEVEFHCSIAQRNSNSAL